MELLHLGDISLSWILAFILMALLVCFYLDQTSRFNTWSSLGIPGPKPVFFFGFLPEKNDATLLDNLLLMKEKYGRTYGMYFTKQPILTTSDPEMLKEITVKHFKSFADRFNGMEHLTMEFSKKMLFLSNGQAWKRYRRLMSPAFSTGKLKMLQSHIAQCSQTLATVFIEKAKMQEDINLKEVYSRFTLDVIAGTAFGLDTRLQTTDDTVETHDLVTAMRNMMADVAPQHLMIISNALPWLGPPLRALGFTSFPRKHMNFFKNCITSLMKERDQNPDSCQGQADFLGQMMAVRQKPGDPDQLDQDGTNHKLSETEVVAQGIQVFNAGFETTASTLRFLSYCLAQNPHVQERIHREITEVVGEGEVTYEHLQELKFLDCSIHEALRLYPIIPFLSRTALETVQIKGYTIPRGTCIFLSIYAATHDADLFPDPDTFKPERFEDPHRDASLDSLPFGMGPRQCIGMRLALLEMKIAIVYVLRRVRFKPCDKTVDKIKFAQNVLLVPTKPLILRTEVRGQS